MSIIYIDRLASLFQILLTFPNFSKDTDSSAPEVKKKKTASSTFGNFSSW